MAFVGINPNSQLFDPKTGLLTRDGFQVFQAILAFYAGATSAAVTTDGVQTLTHKTMSGFANTFTHLPTAALATKTGSDGSVVTGVAGTSGNLAQWDSAGNIVNGPNLSATLLAGYLDKTFVANGTVATAMSNLGPAGSNTTIQGWITVSDATGLLLGYTPYF